MEGHVIEDKYPSWMNIENSQVTHIVTPDDMLNKGLLTVKYDEK
jgi:hypothetical protein